MRTMRQVIKTNHNFMTGEHYEQRVLKPVQASHNRVTIQLCDAASGQVVEEAVTENAITPLFECSAYGFIAQQLNNKELNGGFNYPSFASIVLSDSDIGELEDLYFIHGNVVGLCNRNDTAGAGNSRFRGTYNSAESYERFEDNGYRHIHLVYDWPTSSGNGKIQNIYWLTSYFTFNAGYLRAIGSMSTFNNVIKDNELFFDKRGNTYRRVNNKYYKVLNLLKYVNGIEPAKLAIEESFHNNFEVNGYYYTFSYSSADVGTTSCTFILTINKHDTNGTIVDTWTEDLITAAPQLVELRNNSWLGGYDTMKCEAVGYCDDNGWVGFKTRYCARGTAYRVFPQRNSAGELEPNSSFYAEVYTMYNVLTKQWLRVPNPWDIWCTYTHWADHTVLKKIDNRHITTSGVIINIDTGSSNVTGVQYSINWRNLGVDDFATYPIRLHATLPIAVCAGYYDDSLYAINPISAQTRLAAPITKTTLNTMKIQYDFFFKVPLPYLPPEHVWDLYK